MLISRPNYRGGILRTRVEGSQTGEGPHTAETQTTQRKATEKTRAQSDFAMKTGVELIARWIRECERDGGRVIARIGGCVIGVGGDFQSVGIDAGWDGAGNFAMALA